MDYLLQLGIIKQTPLKLSMNEKWDGQIEEQS